MFCLLLLSFVEIVILIVNLQPCFDLGNDSVKAVIAIEN